MVNLTKQIKISRNVKRRLDTLKQYERETYNDVLVRLLDIKKH